jgi:hypothetical protein
MKTKLHLSALLFPTLRSGYSLRPIFVLCLLSFVIFNLSSQVPQGFNYQAIARDAAGNPIIGATISVRLSILTDTSGFFASGNGTYLWEETHSNVKTNAFGLFTVVLGNPAAVKFQGTAASFSAINWTTAPLYIGTKIFYPGSWKNLGTAKLWTVPYSMVSGNLSGPVKKLAVNSLNTSPDSAIFEVKNNTGQTVFAVYNEGVRVYVDNGIVKGSTKGGFAIGGFGTAKAPSQNLMMISPDSARIYVNETVTKGSTKGGFAIGGFNPVKGSTNKFMLLTPQNYFIGHNSGKYDTVGLYNSTMGYESGMSLVTGSNNVFMGYQSGLNTYGGGSNVFIGNSSGFSNISGSSNVFIGNTSGLYNTSGSSNVFIGNTAGYYNSTGNYNIVLGRAAGYHLSTGWGNILMGDYAGTSINTGLQNVIIGDLAGITNTLGSSNVFLGANSGYLNSTGAYNNFMGAFSGNTNTTGSFNSFIGYRAGYNNTIGQYNTYIGYQAGYSGVNASGSNNIFMGVEAGYSNTSGVDNIAIGNKAGRSNLDGTYNIMLGSNSGNMNVTGDYNTMVGYNSGQNTIANWNTMLGFMAGMSNTTGGSQVMIGYQAGNLNTGGFNTLVGSLAGGASGTGTFNTYVGIAAGNNATGSNNVFLGKWAGEYEPGSYKLIIETNYSGADNLNNALVFGDFSSRFLKVNGQILSSVNKPAGWVADFRNTGGIASNYGLNIAAGTSDGSGVYNYMIDFNSGNGTWKGAIMIKDGVVSLYSISDARQKENISKSGINALKILDDLQVMDYNFTKSPGTKHTGYIAQDAEKVLPEMVVYNEKADAYAVSTSALIPVLHKAIQEQQKMIGVQAVTIENQEKQLQSLQSRLEKLEAMITKSGVK